MRKIGIIMAALGITILSVSCASYNYIVTDIHRDLSVRRTVYAEADSAYLADRSGQTPFIFMADSSWDINSIAAPFSMNFYDDSNTMNIYARKTLENISEGRFTPGREEYEGSPVLYPEESVKKRFRWFYTIYDYKADYKQISGLPVPLDDFIGKQEQELFFKGGNIPDDWNGIELYCKLDDINSRFARWYITSTFRVSYDILRQFCDSAMSGKMESLSEDMLARLSGDEEDVTPDKLCRMLDSATKGDYFTRLYAEHKEEVDAQYDEKTAVTDYFQCAVISEINMPGTLVRTNATAFNNGNPQWKVDCYRLLCGNLELTARSRETNIWAYILTFIILAGGIYLLIRK